MIKLQPAVKSTLVAYGSFLQNRYKAPGVFEELLLHSIKLYFDITTSRSFALNTCVLSISFIQSVNGAKFLNIACLFDLLFYLFGAFAAAIAPAPTVVMAPPTNRYVLP